MNQSFFFYDLETSGFNPREQRIMQFAGQRTTMELEPVGEPINLHIKLTEDVLPDPEAILVTGITPQKTIEEGLSEAVFLKLFSEEIAKPNTIFVGYNSVRFDDEFVRYLHYRNFYDPYEWHWQEGRSRWDLLDVVRMTRALRPDGVNWPKNEEGLPTNKLELLTAINHLEHSNAHDALSDVSATIAVAGLIKSKQPRLFDYLLKMRHKKTIEQFVKTGHPFVYTSGKYSNLSEKTTVAVYFADNPKSGCLVYDLRHDPTKWLKMTPEQLVDAWQWKPESDEVRLPIKTLQFNRCPAVAPLTVLDDESKQRIDIDSNKIDANLRKLNFNSSFKSNVLKAVVLLNQKQQEARQKEDNIVDAQLYEGFFNDQDKASMYEVRQASETAIGSLSVNFIDKRLNELLPLYKARNFYNKISHEEIENWENYRSAKLLKGGESSRAFVFYQKLNDLVNNPNLNKNQEYLLEELKLYAESILQN